MPVDDDEIESEEEAESGLDGIPSLGPTEEEIEEHLNSISFEWCETVRSAGSFYRDQDSLDETADQLGLSIQEAREAVATYIHIFTYEGSDDADITIVPGEAFGLRYFRDDEVDPEDINEDVSWENVGSPEEVREEIRIFVAHHTQNIDLENIDLDQDIPQSPHRTLPSVRAAQNMQRFGEILQEAMQVPAARFATMVNQLEQDIIRNITRPLNETLQEIDFEALRERQRIREALQGGIFGFEPPESYSPETISIEEETKSVGEAALDNFIENIWDSNVNDLDDYINRLEYGLERYREDDYIASTLVFLSVQDGFLDTINQQVGHQPSGGHYSYNDRQKAFEDEFPEIFGIQGTDVASQWEDFLNHRHKIMHGDPDAHLDENIASVSLIFLVLAIYTALDLLGVN